MNSNNLNKHKNSFFFIAALSFSFLIFLLGCQVIKHMEYIKYTSIVPFHFFPEDIPNLRPEPYEQAFFFFGLFCLPLVSLLSYWWLTVIDRKNPMFFHFTANEKFNRVKKLLTVALLFGWAYQILVHTSGSGATWESAFRINHDYYIFRLMILCILGVILLQSRRREIKGYFVFSLALVILALTSFVELRTEPVFLSTGDTSFHFGIIMGAINQVFHGQTILTDISSEYGILYPYFMSWLSRMFGYSIFKVSIYFVSLIFLSYLFIYLAFRKLFGKGWYGLVALLFVLGIAHPFYESVILRAGQNLPYYQYNPIRLIFSSFFIWYIRVFLREETRTKYCFGFFLSGLAMLWNLDTGIPLALSWTGFLAYNSLAKQGLDYRQKLKSALGHLGILAATTGLTILGYSLFTYWRSGRLPQWLELFRFHEIFYKSGNNMLPMAPFDLWNIVLFIYLAALLGCMIALLNGRVQTEDKFKFFLALLGVGIFIYYQGRSHVLNLFPVSYPCLILIAMFIHEFMVKYGRRIRDWKKLPGDSLFGWDLIKVFPLLIIFAYGVLNFVTLLPVLQNWVKITAKEVNQPVMLDQNLAETVQFITDHKKSDRIVIIADNNDYLYYKTNSFSPFPVASLIEVLCQEQMDSLAKVITDGQVEQVFYIEGSPNRFVSSLIPVVKGNYAEKKKNESGRIILYERVPKGSLQ